MVGKNPPPDERVVYLALKNVFKGQDADIRQNKAVRKLVRRHKGQEDVASLVQGHGLDVVCNTARTLLLDEIFASTLKAKIRFPELFDLSPTQSAEREASEAEAARHEADAIQHAVQGRWEDLEPVDPGPSRQGNFTGELHSLKTGLAAHGNQGSASNRWLSRNKILRRQRTPRVCHLL